jgi:hypothetical protein
MYPFSLSIHEAEIEDEIQENIAGLQTEIYFPTYFRCYLCDYELLANIVNYYSGLSLHSQSFEAIREDLYLLIHIIGRTLSATSSTFAEESDKKRFRMMTVNFITRLLREHCIYDSYLIMCLCKINIKFMSIENEN